MNVIAEMEKVLAEEQECLLRGRYSELAAIAERKANLADRLSAAARSLDRNLCRRVAEKAAHNEALLRSAQRGIQAAMKQLHQIAGGENQSTYSRAGERRPLSRTPSSVVQKL